MFKFKALFAALMVTFALFAPMAQAQDTEIGSRGLFVNLTTDDTWAAAKAISFAHNKALANGHSPVAIWLNVRAVYLAEADRPSHVHGLMREENKSIKTC